MKTTRCTHQFKIEILKKLLNANVMKLLFTASDRSKSFRSNFKYNSFI